MSTIAKTPEPPYYAVIFTTRSSGVDTEAYQETARKMEDLAATQPGYLGMESARSPDGLGITVSYWENTSAIAAWKANADHQVAQQLGRNQWYEQYELRISRVETAYGYERGDMQ